MQNNTMVTYTLRRTFEDELASIVHPSAARCHLSIEFDATDDYWRPDKNRLRVTLNHDAPEKQRRILLTITAKEHPLGSHTLSVMLNRGGYDPIHPTNKTRSRFGSIHSSPKARALLARVMDAIDANTARNEAGTVTLLTIATNVVMMPFFELAGLLRPGQLAHIGTIVFRRAAVLPLFSDIRIVPVLRRLLPEFAAIAPRCRVFQFNLGFEESLHYMREEKQRALDHRKLAEIVESIQARRAREAEAEWKSYRELLAMLAPRLPLHFYTIRQRFVEFLDLAPVLDVTFGVDEK